MPRSLAPILVLAALAASPPAAEARPGNLSERAVSNPPPSLAEGAKLTVTDRASGKARRAVVRYYLSADRRLDLGDVRLHGRRSMRRASGKAKLRVPYTVPTTPMRLLACADDTGVVRERREGDNCRASKRTTRVSVAAKDASVPRSANDARRLPEPDAAFLAHVRFDQSECPTAGGAAGTKPPSLRAAVRTANRRLDAVAGPAAVAQFKASAAARDAGAAEDAAGRAVLAGKPGAALKALLAAHADEPKEAAHLVNAGGLMAATGMPNEALALLAAADDRESRRSAPMGINTQAVALNAQGYALLGLGRLDQAARLFRAALEIDPYFAEARSNLGAALQCEEAGKGIRFLRAGAYRFLGDFIIDGGDPFKQPDPIDQFELSAGRQAQLPQFKLPRTIDDAAGQRDRYFAMQQEYLARAKGRNDRIRDELTPAFIAYNELSQRRYTDLLGAINDLSARASIVAISDRMQARQVEIGNHGNAYFEGTGGAPGSKWTQWSQEANAACQSAPDYQACREQEYLARCRPPTEAAHAHWLSLMGAQLRDYAELANLYYPTATGLAANLSDPARQEARSLQIDEALDGRFNTQITSYAGFWATHVRGSNCYAKDAPSEPAGEGEPETPHSPPCPDSLKGVKFAWKIDRDEGLGVPFDVSLEVACERVSVEISTKVAGKDNWIGAFGEFTYVPSTGKVTLFGGPKAGVKLAGTSIGGSLKDGLYVTLSSSGVEDAGFRISPTVQGGLDQFSIKGSDSVDISFAPVFGVER